MPGRIGGNSNSNNNNDANSCWKSSNFAYANSAVNMHRNDLFHISIFWVAFVSMCAYRTLNMNTTTYDYNWTCHEMREERRSHASEQIRAQMTRMHNPFNVVAMLTFKSYTYGRTAALLLLRQFWSDFVGLRSHQLVASSVCSVEISLHAIGPFSTGFMYVHFSYSCFCMAAKHFDVMPFQNISQLSFISYAVATDIHLSNSH